MSSRQQASTRRPAAAALFVYYVLGDALRVFLPRSLSRLNNDPGNGPTNERPPLRNRCGSSGESPPPRGRATLTPARKFFISAALEAWATPRHLTGLGSTSTSSSHWSTLFHSLKLLPVSGRPATKKCKRTMIIKRTLHSLSTGDTAACR